MIDIVLYLDDGWGFADSFANSETDSNFIKESLQFAGFIVNVEKSIFTPTESLEWLGLIWNSADFSLAIPERRVSDLLKLITEVHDKLPRVSARKLAGLTGSVISMFPT